MRVGMHHGISPSERVALRAAAGSRPGQPIRPYSPGLWVHCGNSHGNCNPPLTAVFQLGVDRENAGAHLNPTRSATRVSRQRFCRPTGGRAVKIGPSAGVGLPGARWIAYPVCHANGPCRRRFSGPVGELPVFRPAHRRGGAALSRECCQPILASYRLASALAPGLWAIRSVRGCRPGDWQSRRPTRDRPSGLSH